MFLGLLALFIGNFFGSTVVPIGTKITAPLTGELVFLTLRFAIVVIILFILLIFSKSKQVHLHDYKDFAFLGFLLTFNNLIFVYAIAHTTIIMSSLIYSIPPLVVGLIGHYYFKESLNKSKFIGLFIAFSGLLFLFSQSLLHAQNNTFGTLFGNLLIFIGMLGFSLYIILSRKVLHINKNFSVQTTFLTFLFAAFYLIIILLIGLIFGHITPQRITHAGAIGIILVGAGSVPQYLLLQVGIKKTTAFTASLFQYIGPFITAAVSIPLLHEQITLNLIIGGALILTGVFIATTYKEIKEKINKNFIWLKR